MAHELSHFEIPKLVNRNNESELFRALEILVQTRRSSIDLEYLVDFIKTLDDLRDYILNLSSYLHLKLCRELTVELHRADEIVFNKGDDSDKLFIILKGKLDMLNPINQSEYSLIGTLGPGKMIGERGLARNLPRSLSARARGNALLLTLNSSSFKEIMFSSVNANLEEKLKLLELCIPELKKYTMPQKERIAYDMEKCTYHRGDVILKEDTFQDSLFMIQEGSCIISSGSLQSRRIITRVGPNSCFGEEGVFLGRKSKFTVTVSSEYVKMYKIKKNNAMILIPENCIRAVQSTYRVKEQGRSILASLTNSPESSESESNEAFDYLRATPHARKRLKEITKRTERLKIKNSDLDLKRVFTKQRLEMLRTVTEDRLNKYSEPILHPKSLKSLTPRKYTSESRIALRRMRNFSINI